MPEPGFEDFDDDIWLARQFAWDPNAAPFNGDVDACVEAWYADVAPRFENRTSFPLRNCEKIGKYDDHRIPGLVKLAMKYRINNVNRPLSVTHTKRMTENNGNGPGTRVFDKLVTDHDEGLRPGEYRRTLVSAADAALRINFINKALQIINNTNEFTTVHPVTGEELQDDEVLKFNISFPDGFISPEFEQLIETTEITEGTDMNTLPVEVVAEYATLSAIIDRSGNKMNTGTIFPFVGNLDGSKKGAVAGVAGKLMAELGYGRDLEPTSTLYEIEIKLNNLMEEYNIQESGETKVQQIETSYNVPVMKIQIQNVANPDLSTNETIKLEDFLYTHKNSDILKDQIVTILPPHESLNKDLFTKLGGTTTSGWNSIGGRSGSYIIKYSRDPLDLLCISTGDGECNQVAGYKYHLEVEENNQTIIKQFRTPGWSSCQCLNAGSTTRQYAAGPYEGIGNGECVIYLYPDDPNGWNRNRPMARLYLRWGFKNWLHTSSPGFSAGDSLSRENRSASEFTSTPSDLSIGSAHEPVIFWEPRPYPHDIDSEFLKQFFYSAWEVCENSYRESGNTIGPSHQTFTVAAPPYQINGYSDSGPGIGQRTVTGGGSVPTFSLEYGGGGRVLLAGETPDYSGYQNPLITETEAMSASDFSMPPGAHEALATNASVWLFPAAVSNLRTNGSSSSRQMLASSQYATPQWLTSCLNGNSVRLDPYFNQPWKSQNLVNTLSQNPQIFNDPVDGYTTEYSHKFMMGLNNTFLIHKDRYTYRPVENQQEVIMDCFRDLEPDLNGTTTLDIGSAFDIFYLGLLHPSNALDSTGIVPFITCLPEGNTRITRGAPELLGKPIGIEAVVEDFLNGSLFKSNTKLIYKTRQILSNKLWSNCFNMSMCTSDDYLRYVEKLIIWKNLCTSPFITDESFSALLTWYDNLQVMLVETYGADGFIVKYYIEMGRRVLGLWLQPHTSSNDRGFKSSSSYEYAVVSQSWKLMGWPERQTSRFTSWCLRHFSLELGLVPDAATMIEMVRNPIQNTKVFAPFAARTESAWVALEEWSKKDGFGETFAPNTIELFRFYLLFNQISNTDTTVPISDLGGLTFVGDAKYQLLLTEALELALINPNISDALSQFQYSFLPLSEKLFRSVIPDAIQNSIMDKGSMIGYNLTSSFLRNPERIERFARDRMQDALGDYYPEYIETGVLPKPPSEDRRTIRNLVREKNMNLKILGDSAIGGGAELGGLCRNESIPNNVSNLIINDWLILCNDWNFNLYAHNYENISKALAENSNVSSEILKIIFNNYSTLQEQITENPNCPPEILDTIYGLEDTEDYDNPIWVDDANPLAAMINVGISADAYQNYWDLMIEQLHRDATTMDDVQLDNPWCMTYLESAKNQFYEYTDSSARTNQITSILSANPSLRFWRGGNDKAGFTSNVSVDDTWHSMTFPGIESDETCVRYWRLPSGTNPLGQVSTVSPGIVFNEENDGVLHHNLEVVLDNGELPPVDLTSPFVLIKYNSQASSGRGDGHQTTCSIYDDSPVLGKSTFGQMLFIQKLYKIIVGRGDRRYNEDTNSWVGRRYVWTFDGYWYDDGGVKHDGSTYQAESLDELFGWLGEDRYNEVGWGAGRGEVRAQGLKWAQGVVVCITDADIVHMAQRGDNAFDYYYGQEESVALPIPLWRQNWTNADSLTLLRTLLNKGWFVYDGPLPLNLLAVRDDLKSNPIRIYKPGGSPGSEPMLDLSTLMQALDVPNIKYPKDSLWTEASVEEFAFDILQVGRNAFSQLKNLPISINTPSLLLPLLMTPDICNAYNLEPVGMRQYAIRSDAAETHKNVLNILLNSFHTTIENLSQVDCGKFRGTEMGTGTRSRREAIISLLQSHHYREILPIEFITCLYIASKVDTSLINESTTTELSRIRTSRIDEFVGAYARQRQSILELLSVYGTQGSEYNMALLTTGEDFSVNTFNLALSPLRRFDGDLIPWVGFISSNVNGYVEKLNENLDSFITTLTLLELRDLILTVNSEVNFAMKYVLESGGLYDSFVDGITREDSLFEFTEEEIQATAQLLVISELNGIVGESQADELLQSMLELEYSTPSLDTIIDYQGLRDDSLQSGDVQQPPE